MRLGSSGSAGIDLVPQSSTDWIEADEPEYPVGVFFHAILLLCFRWLVLVWIGGGALIASSDNQGQNSRTLLTIPIRVNDREVFFLVDTGANHSAIDRALVQELRLPGTGMVSVRRNYSVQEMPTVVAEQIQIGSKVFSKVVLLATDLGALSQAQNQKIDGVVGADILASTYVSLMYSTGTIQMPTQLRNPGTPVSIKNTDDGFFVPVTIGPRQFWLLLDSGTNMTAISFASWQALSSAARPESLIDGIRSAETLVDSALGCAPTLKIGETVLRNQPIRVVQPTETGNFANQEFTGILGQDVLQHFDITLDLGHSLLYLRPNRAYRVEPYEFETIGVQFLKAKEGGFVVAAVWRNSPAAESGISVGDRIVSVDGRKSDGVDLRTFSRRLHKVAGTHLTLVVERHGREFAVKVRTRRLACTTAGKVS